MAVTYCAKELDGELPVQTSNRDQNINVITVWFDKKLHSTQQHSMYVTVTQNYNMSHYLDWLSTAVSQ